MKYSNSISKVLSANDTGETGGHQAGILIPKDKRLLSFFPTLMKNEKNPRAHISFIDDSGKKWVFAYIYYNNRMFGGTRDEYRLTRMTKYINENLLKSGDIIHLTYIPVQDKFSVSFSRKNVNNFADDPNVLVIGKSWIII